MQTQQFLSFKRLFVLLLFFVSQKVEAQPTSLTAGDIAFSGYISNTINQVATEDGFSFVLLKNINKMVQLSILPIMVGYSAQQMLFGQVKRP
jgi:hypothetical protein